MNEPWGPGTRVGEYVLQERLGAGGMGEVFAALHEPSGARRALKALALRAPPHLRQRFEREGQAMAAVDAHPNVVRIHAAGEHLGRPYLVMDLAAGGDLKDRLRHGPLPPEEAARVVRALALGLESVHANGVLHRDLKPANILFDERGTPKLVDFGLARIDDAGSLTESGAFMGTPSYMSPEQVDGRAEARSDVYSLGAVLYHALTGQPPFSGATSVNIVSQVLTQPPAPPRSLAPEVPEELERVCLQTLAKDPAERPPSAAALAEALTGFLEEGDAPRARFMVPLLFVCLGLLVAVGLVSTAWPRGEPDETTKTEHTTKTAEAEPANAVEVRTPWRELGRGQLFAPAVPWGGMRVLTNGSQDARGPQLWELAPLGGERPRRLRRWSSEGWEHGWAGRSPTLSAFVTATGRGLVLYGLGESEPLGRADGVEATAVVFLPSGQLAVGSRRAVTLFTVTMTKPFFSRGFSWPVTAKVKALAASGTVVVAATKRAVIAWDVNRHGRLLHFKPGSDRPACIAIHGSTIFVGTERGGRRVRSQGGRLLRLQLGRPDSVVAFEDGDLARYGHMGGRPAHKLTVRGVCFSPGGRRVVSFSGEHRELVLRSNLKVWDVATGKRVGVHAPFGKAQVSHVVRSRDGTRVAVSLVGRGVRLLALED